MIRLATVIDTFEADFLTQYRGRLRPEHYRALAAMKRCRTASSLKMAQRTVSGADFLWLVLQHVLPKGFRRARNFGFLHPNCKRLIALLQVLLKFDPGRSMACWAKERAPILCACCGAAMLIVKTRTRSVFPGGVSAPFAPARAQ